MNRYEVTAMDIPVEFRCVDISDREIVVYAMGIGEQRHGRMIRYVDRAVRERVALHDEREREKQMQIASSSTREEHIII